MKRMLLVALAALVVAAPAQAAKVRPADRAALNALLDRFVPAVVAGKDLKAGKALVGGYVSVGTIQRYPAKGTVFHGWRLNYAQPGDIGFDLLLQPTRKSLGPWSFRGEAQKIGGVWKIVVWYPVAEFQPAGKSAWVNGPNDLTPGAKGSVGPSAGHLWYLWLIPAAVAALLAAVGAYLTQRWLRQRSRVRAIERTLAGTR